ncbi:hypothetical protein GCM10017673_28930 [Streptosporangium violaceochromogenes]|nr:hypothetical protein GCM10017673_28930 [Streptosporangium violaceochromogenes]
MIGQPRAPGRHRAGQPHSLVHRRLWDGPARDQAEALERSRPGWVVWYGPGSRRFYAAAAWPAPESIMVEAATADDLHDRMNETETALLLRAATSTSSTAGTPGQPRRPRPSGTRRRTVRHARSLPYPPEGSAA